jgi:hypothetical protein
LLGLFLLPDFFKRRYDQSSGRWPRFPWPRNRPEAIRRLVEMALGKKKGRFLV